MTLSGVVVPYNTTDKVGGSLFDSQKIPRMTIDELKSRLSDASLVIIDIRSGGDWNGSSIKIKGAIREVYSGAEQWAPKYDQDKTIVLYCA
jgi:hypothetical protein